MHITKQRQEDSSMNNGWKIMSQGLDTAYAAYQLGRRYELGDGVQVDLQSAARFYRRAALRGLADAQLALGFLHATGQGVSRNEELAFSWMAAAAGQDHPDAQHNLGVMYAEGRGVELDQEAAIKWFYRAATNGSIYAREWLESHWGDQAASE